jgi:DNA-3-methyladenine glycosylase
MARDPAQVLPQSFYARDALEVAPELLGKLVSHAGVVLRISEVEAYRHPGDSASHCRMGPTPRNAPMWGPGGHAYVYLCYGMHQMLNLVTNGHGEGAAVLIRACEPVSGHALIAQRRTGITGPLALNGPGKVGAALALDASCSGPENQLLAWRFALEDSLWVSHRKTLQPAVRDRKRRKLSSPPVPTRSTRS